MAPDDRVELWRETVITRDGNRWSNAAEDRVEIEVYDPEWPARYEAEARLIRDALGAGFEYRVWHAGSTAVPGLAAKPIIDVVLAVPDRERWPSLVQPLATLEYLYWAENPDTSEMFFVKGMPPLGRRRTHLKRGRLRATRGSWRCVQPCLKRG